MTSWLKRLGDWLVTRPWWVWVSIVAVMVVFLIRYWFSLTGESSVRIMGLVFQLLGLATVAKGLKDTRALFRRPGILTLINQWLHDVPIFTPKPSIPVSSSARISISTRLNLVVPSIEDRLTILEKRLSEDSQVRAEALDLERRTREDAVQELRRQLEEFAAGGLHLESIGLVWILLGTILGTASVEIEKIIKIFL